MPTKGSSYGQNPAASCSTVSTQSAGLLIAGVVEADCFIADSNGDTLFTFTIPGQSPAAFVTSFTVDFPTISDPSQNDFNFGLVTCFASDGDAALSMTIVPGCTTSDTVVVSGNAMNGDGLMLTAVNSDNSTSATLTFMDTFPRSQSGHVTVYFENNGQSIDAKITDIEVSAAPEPSSLSFFATASVVGLGLLLLRQRRRAANCVR